MPAIVLIRGGGDLASGVALRLHRVGLSVVITELPKPMAVRRRVCFAEAVNAGETSVEGVVARRVTEMGDALDILQILAKGRIPVLVDPEAEAARTLYPMVIVDGRMLKHPPEALRHSAKLFIGLGPGFKAGENCHAAIETNRGHRLGRVIWEGTPQADTGLPEAVGERRAERVLRAPADGILWTRAEIGDLIEAGQVIADVAGVPVEASFGGVLRGLLPAEFEVKKGMKIGDLDPRNDPDLCTLVSEKALAVGGGVLEAILSRPQMRTQLWASR